MALKTVRHQSHSPQKKPTVVLHNRPSSLSVASIQSAHSSSPYAKRRPSLQLFMIMIIIFMIIKSKSFLVFWIQNSLFGATFRRDGKLGYNEGNHRREILYA